MGVRKEVVRAKKRILAAEPELRGTLRLYSRLASVLKKGDDGKEKQGKV